MDVRRQMGRHDAERGNKIGAGAAAEAIAAARKPLVVPMLVLRFGLAVVVSVFLRARLVVSGVQMKRSMGTAAGESERQD